MHPPPALLPDPDNRDHEPPARRARTLSHSTLVGLHKKWQVFSDLNIRSAPINTIKHARQILVRHKNTQTQARTRTHAWRFKVIRHGVLMGFPCWPTIRAEAEIPMPPPPEALGVHLFYKHHTQHMFSLLARLISWIFQSFIPPLGKQATLEMDQRGSECLLIYPQKVFMNGDLVSLSS